MNERQRERSLGADLVCFVVADRIDFEAICGAIDACARRGFRLLDEAMLFYGADPIVPDEVVPAGRVESALHDLANGELPHRIIVRLTGRIGSGVAPLSMTAAPRRAVMELSVLDTLIFGKGEVESRENLREFVTVCKAVANELPDPRALLDTESMSLDEAATAAASWRPAADALSDESIDEFNKWFVNVYMRRWDNTP